MSALNNSPHQTINHSGSMKTNYSSLAQNHLTQTSYVPQPNTTVQYISIPKEVQNVPTDSVPTSSDTNPVVSAAYKKPPQPAEWDVFAYNEYMEKYGEKNEWEF